MYWASSELAAIESIPAQILSSTGAIVLDRFLDAHLRCCAKAVKACQKQPQCGYCLARRAASFISPFTWGLRNAFKQAFQIERLRVHVQRAIGVAGPLTLRPVPI